MVNWWFGFLLDLPMKRIVVISGSPLRGPQNTGPQTTILPFVDHAKGGGKTSIESEIL